MNNCYANNLDFELMVYYGYTTSNSASNVDKLIKKTNIITTQGIKITELKINIDNAVAQVRNINPYIEA